MGKNLLKHVQTSFVSQHSLRETVWHLWKPVVSMLSVLDKLRVESPMDEVCINMIFIVFYRYLVISCVVFCFVISDFFCYVCVHWWLPMFMLYSNMSCFHNRGLLPLLLSLHSLSLSFFRSLSCSHTLSLLEGVVVTITAWTTRGYTPLVTVVPIGRSAITGSTVVPTAPDVPDRPVGPDGPDRPMLSCYLHIITLLYSGGLRPVDHTC